MKKAIKIVLIILFPLYIVLSLFLYFMQEKLIFLPSGLDGNYKFDFDQDFEELYLKSKDGVAIHSILFKAKKQRGVVLYLHGNAGTLAECGYIAPVYASLEHDVFMIDYRGYGKSEGDIFSEQQFYDDAQLAYDELKTRYPEEQITIIGYSVGTAAAAMLAANNNPRQLILNAPYYSVVDMTEHRYPIAPTFMLKYKFRTHSFIRKINSPITIFHGEDDAVIYHGSALKLQKHFRPKDNLITLKEHDHDNFEDNEQYLAALKEIL